MGILVRILLGIVWLSGIGACWHGHKLGTAASLALAALGVVTLSRPATVARRREGSNTLRYVHMGKEPTRFY